MHDSVPEICDSVHLRTLVRRVLAPLFLLCASTSFGATIELEAFDLKRCLHWHMTSDTGGAQSPAYRAALTKVPPGFSIFSAGASAVSGAFIEKYGSCSFEYKKAKIILQCSPNQDFPFAGATFESSNSQPFSSATVLSCTSGCAKDVPQFIYEINQDIPDDPKANEAAEERRTAQFRKACGRK